jgi:hypothetical protein
LSSTAGSPQWVSVDLSHGSLPGPTEIKTINIYGSHNAPDASPSDFELQYSDDNVGWTTALAVANETGWTAAELRTFEVF